LERKEAVFGDLRNPWSEDRLTHYVLEKVSVGVRFDLRIGIEERETVLFIVIDELTGTCDFIADQVSNVAVGIFNNRVDIPKSSADKGQGAIHNSDWVRQILSNELVLVNTKMHNS
jgi:hypothetical protein